MGVAPAGGHLIVDVQGVALMVIGMRLAVKIWDTNIRGREDATVDFSRKALLITLNHCSLLASNFLFVGLNS